MAPEKKGSLLPWQASPSEHDRPHAEYSSDPTSRVDAYSPPSIWRDIKSLLLIFLSIAVIAGVIYERWFFFPQQSDQPNTASTNTPTAPVTTKPSSLLPFCPPERDECWIREEQTRLH